MIRAVAGVEATDTFDTAGLRRRVLEAWAASPARFREDANAEEELVLGAYRDRLIVELAQNAADAAGRAGQPGRLRLTLRQSTDAGAVLTAANTGAPVDRAGVESLSTLRASTKRGSGGVGRFGVGFAAVLAVSDAPIVRSRTGAVAWSAQRTRDLVATIPALGEEAAARNGSVPVLRLPFAEGGEAPEGYDTEIVLPLRDGRALDQVRRLLDDVDDALLLALPDLVAVEIDSDAGLRVLTAQREHSWVVVDSGGSRTRWRLLERSGSLDSALLAGRPVEERTRPDWTLTWALPMSEGQPAPLPASVAAVVHAPTPTDDALDLPVLLLGSFPLDSARRRVAPGALADFLTGSAADGYCDLVCELSGDPAVAPGHVSALIPNGPARGELDAALRRAILARLPDIAFLPAAHGDRRVRPRDAVLVAGGGARLVEVLAPVFENLLPPDWAVPAVARLGARSLSVAQVVEELATCDRTPLWWHELYDALAGVDTEALGGLPVPLADGRSVRGPRDVLLPGAVAPEVLAALGLRAVHPDAAHRLLECLGAVPATAETVLAHPGVRALVDTLWDAEEYERATVTDAVLTLVAATVAGLRANRWAEIPQWLLGMPLLDADGEPRPAGELVLPGSELMDILEPGALSSVSADLVARFGADVLRAVGVMETFAVVRDLDVAVDPDEAPHDLDGESAWLREVARGLRPAGVVGRRERYRAPDLVTEFVAVRDLDLIAAAAWPTALRLLAAPPLRAAVVEPARVRRADGRAVDVVGYTAWWLRTHRVLDGRRSSDLRLPTDFRLADGDPRLAGLWEIAPPGLDEQFARALGIRVTLAEVLASDDGPSDLLTRLADPLREVGREQLFELYRALAELDPDRVPAQPRLRAPLGSVTAVVPAGELVVVDAPDLIGVATGHLLVAPPQLAEGLADVLAIGLASEEFPARVRGVGRPVIVPSVLLRVLTGSPAACPKHYLEHDRLLVGSPEGWVEVEWRWVDGELHAATTRGLSFGMAWAAGAWQRRWLVAAALAEPDRVEEILLDEEFSRAQW